MLRCVGLGWVGLRRAEPPLRRTEPPLNRAESARPPNRADSPLKPSSAEPVGVDWVGMGLVGLGLVWVVWDGLGFG